MLTQITSGAVFGEDNPCLTPLNSYVSEAIAQWTNWLIEGEKSIPIAQKSTF